jgi:rhodanese-related sulfurtransferase
MQPYRTLPARLVFLLFALVVLALMPLGALAFNPLIDLSVQQTYAKMNEGSLVLVDVRTEQEWRQTGIARGATPISMVDPEFLDKLGLVQSANPGKIIAFICASGRRSGIVQAELARRGYKDVYSVYGGTTGSSDAAGWIAEGLPIVAWPGD